MAQLLYGGQSIFKVIIKRMNDSNRYNVIDLGAASDSMFPSAFIHPGEFIMFDVEAKGPEGITSKVGQVISIENFRALPRNEIKHSTVGRFKDKRTRFMLVRHFDDIEEHELSFDDDVKAINPSDYSFIHEAQRELLMTCNYEWFLLVEKAKCFAFIFHSHLIDEGVFNTAGITNAFMCNKLVFPDNSVAQPSSYLVFNKDWPYLRPF
ncbi:hypothetical protein SEMRO_2035_G312070.1 [Seminavis robusta]|uniref:Uncharacterized protein n=1 Tax=Seminavis robusta TaxID=568900 RepID=A0A9N8EUU7_9STRA|nr:hypothetical protein SEMRO_2035_G312070.1 [Seminavis robusta]|eukprot:Sro2035_g312070.1 n/a (208) ;mRNA; f:10993-11616